MEKPLLVTDGRYVFAYHMGMKLGPFNLGIMSLDGQIDQARNAQDPNGVPFNPEACIGGRIHTVDNPMSPPKELFEHE